MKCKDINKSLTAYLDEEVTSEERSQMEAHLASCEKCQEEMRLLAATRENLRQVLRAEAARVEPSSQAWNLIRQRIESGSSLWEQLSTLFSKPVWRAAIPVFVVLLAVGVLWRSGVLPGFQGAPPVAERDMSAQESTDASKWGGAAELSQAPPLADQQPVEIISVSGPLQPVNPGGPTVEITLKNVAAEPVVSLSASLELNRPFNFDFDVSPSNPLLIDESVAARLALIGGGFSENISYPLVISGTLKSGVTFTYTSQVLVVAPQTK